MSTPDRSAPSLPERAEALLRDWPAPSKSALEWEDRANETSARVRETAPGSTPDALLEAPLPKEEAEGTLEVEAPADEPNLVAIARAALAAGASQSPKDVAREVLLAASRQRAHVLAPETAANAAPEPAPVRAVSAKEPDPPFEAAAARVVHAPPEEAVARSEFPHVEHRTGRGLATVGGVALALAAALALYVSVRHGDAEQPGAALATDRPAPAKEAPPVLAEPSVASVAAGAAPVGSGNAAGAPALPNPVAASAATKPVPFDSLASKGEKPSPKKDSLAFHVNEATKGADKLVLEEQPDDTSGMPQAAPAARAPSPAQAAQSTPVEDEKTNAALPSEPTVGVIQAALGSVMSGARSCVVGQEKGSLVALTFSRDGRVKRVVVSPPAQGTPAESCLISALSGARVPAFTVPEYSFSFTVRPP